MKTYLKIMLPVFCIFLTMLPAPAAHAQIPLAEIIRAGIKKVIIATNLKVQRLQNKTIWLQNAQKTLENTLSKLKLDEIAGLAEKQKEQYRKYYDELAKVKLVISYYQRIRDITGKQIRLVGEYNRSWQLLRQDSHFSPGEIDYMAKVYSGILGESLQNTSQISLILRSFSTQMSDAGRLDLINNAANQVDMNYDDLTRFTSQNMLLSLSRAKTKHEVDIMKKLYGLPK